MANLSATKLIRISVQAWSKEKLLWIWETRKRWLYWVLIPSGLLVYFPMKPELIGIGQTGLHLSNLTVNVSIMCLLWFWFVDDIARAVWKKVLRRKSKCPAWFNVVMLVTVVFGLIYYLTLWGYETRW